MHSQLTFSTECLDVFTGSRTDQQLQLTHPLEQKHFLVYHVFTYSLRPPLFSLKIIFQKISFQELSFFFFFGGGYPWRLHESQNTLVSTLKPSKVKCQRSVQSTLKAMVETSKGTTQRQVWCCWICRSDCPGSSLGTKHPPPLWPWGRLLTTNFSFSHLENR